MIGFVMVGTNNLEKAIKFYDELLEVVGLKRILLEKPGGINQE